MKLRLVALIALVAGASFAGGYLSRGEDVASPTKNDGAGKARRNKKGAAAANQAPPPGLWQRATHGLGPADAAQADPGDEEFAKRLSELGYLAGYEKASGDTGVVVHDEQRCYEGLNLYTSGHGSEATLIDMDGAVRHAWRYDVAQLWPDEAESFVDGGYFRRAHLFENGDLLAIYDSRDLESPQHQVLIKLDRDSNLIWSYGPGVHHDLQVLDDGRILTLTCAFRQDPDVFDGRRVLDDYVTILGANGQLEKRVSILDCYRNSVFSSTAESTPSPLDVLHTNTIELLDGRLAARSPAFRAGNVLVSTLHLDAVSVLDLEREQVVWSLIGLWKNQHQPTILDNGDLMVFDNRGCNGFSKVIELDPFTQEVRWSYDGDESNRFYSVALGAAARLPNGNTLITESTSGRAFEVTESKEIVWEFHNPRRAGAHGELIATLCEVVRLPADYAASWLD